MSELFDDETYDLLAQEYEKALKKPRKTELERAFSGEIPFTLEKTKREELTIGKKPTKVMPCPSASKEKENENCTTQFYTDCVLQSRSAVNTLLKLALQRGYRSEGAVMRLLTGLVEALCKIPLQSTLGGTTETERTYGTGNPLSVIAFELADFLEKALKESEDAVTFCPLISRAYALIVFFGI